jgi:hypothetical protein
MSHPAARSRRRFVVLAGAGALAAAGVILIGRAAEPAATASKAPELKVPAAVAPPPAGKGSSGVDVLVPAKLHQVQVTIPRDEWDVLVTQTNGRRGGRLDSLEDDIDVGGRLVHISGGFGGYFPWVHADLAVDGRTIKDTGFRYKGNGSYSPMAGMHRSIKVKTDLFGGKSDWDGLETLNFNSGGRDPSRTREAMAFAIFRMAGVPAARTAYAEMRYTVPGLHERAYGGLFTVIENVNKQFLKHHLPPGTGLLMKPEGMGNGLAYFGESWGNYTHVYRPQREATPAEAKRVIEFARLVNAGTVEEFRAKIGSFLDVDAFLRFLAVHALIHARDSFLSGSHNYFIYLDPKDDRFRFIPWDLDGAMGGGNMNSSGMFGTDLMAPWSRENPLAYYLLDDPATAARYQVIVRDILAKAFNREKLIPIVDQLEAVVEKPLILEDAAMASRGEYENGGRGGTPRDFLENRFFQVQQQMVGWGRISP